MKNLSLILLTAVALLCSCQNKAAKTVTASTEINASSDSMKSCCAKSDTKACCTSSDSISMTGVQVLYFHNERRCATCMAVEEGAIDVVKQLNLPSVTFSSFLIGDPKSADIEKKFGVDGQTLLVVGKGQVINLTEMAFMNARIKPDTYKEELNAQIGKLK